MKGDILEIIKRCSKKWHFLVILVLAIFLALPYLNSAGVPYGAGANDTLFHMSRLMSVANAIKDGQLIPQVDPAAISGRGLGINLFYGPLLVYIFTALRIIVFGWERAYKILVLGTFFAIGLSMYFFAYSISKKKTISLIAASLYMTSPYLLSDVYIRGAWGEIPVFVFMPLLFAGIVRVLKEKKYGYLSLSVGAMGIVLCHMLSIVIVFPFALFFVLLNIKAINRRIVRKCAVCIVISIGLTAFFWLPVIEAKLTGLYLVFNSDEFLYRIPQTAAEMKGNGLNLYHFFLQDPMYGTNGVSTFHFSAFVIVGMVLFVVALKKIPSSIRKTGLCMLAITAIASALALKKFPWEHVPDFLLNIQFPWRFCMVSSFSSAMFASLGIYYTGKTIFETRKEVVIVFVGLVAFLASGILMRVAYLFPRITFSEVRDHYGYYNGITAMEYFPVALCRDKEALDKESCPFNLINEVDDGQAVVKSSNVEIRDYEKNGTNISFYVDRASDGESSYVVVPVFYYPGYEAVLETGDGEKVALKTDYSEQYGFVRVSLETNENGKVAIRYGLSNFTKIGVATSVISMVAIISYESWIIIRKSKNEKRSK